MVEGCWLLRGVGWGHVLFLFLFWVLPFSPSTSFSESRNRRRVPTFEARRTSLLFPLERLRAPSPAQDWPTSGNDRLRTFSLSPSLPPSFPSSPPPSLAPSSLLHLPYPAHTLTRAHTRVTNPKTPQKKKTRKRERV